MACFCLSREARARPFSISICNSLWRALTRSFNIEITSSRKLASSKESLLDADGLAGEHLGQIDLLAIEADTAAVVTRAAFATKTQDNTRWTAVVQPRLVSSKSSAMLESNAMASRLNVSIRTSSLLDSNSLTSAWRRPAALASCSWVIL